MGILSWGSRPRLHAAAPCGADFPNTFLAAILARMAAFLVTQITILMRMAAFLVTQVTILMRMAAFLVTQVAILIRMAAFLASRVSFLTRKEIVRLP